MDKRKKCILLLIFLLGLAAGFILSYAVRGRGAADTSGPPANGRQEEGRLIPAAPGSALPAAAGHAAASSPVPQAILTSGQSCAEWDKSTTYTGGDKAAYGGRIYRAKWWTLGEIPGQADVWEDTLEPAVRPDKTGSHSTLSSSHAGPPASSYDGSRTSTGANSPAVTKAGALSPAKVVGYYPDWKSYQPRKLQMDVLTHIAYAFAIPTPDGGLLPLENPETAVRLIEDAHKNQVKVLLAVGGWSYNGAELEPVFVSATSTSEKTRQFGDEILAMCNEYGFDGVDMDWEHPRVDGPSGDQYQELILYLADALHAQGKLLTSAVISGVSADGNIYYDAAAHSDAVLNAVDWIHVMAYDGGDGERHSSYEFAVNCAAYWSGTRNVPAGKVVLGVPFYGRPGWAPYRDILAADPEAWNKDHALVNGMDVWYNGISTIEKKAAYARENLGGIMVWELTQDTDDSAKSLLSAIGRGIR